MMTENHSKFIGHLRESKAAVWLVAQWLNSKGYSVKVNPIREAPEHAKWEGYADDGDIEISQRVEVKRLSSEFTSAHDWPHGRHFIVCAKHSFDRAAPKPFAYVYLSKSGTSAAVVIGSTKGSWYAEKRRDQRYSDVYQTFYFCPLEHIKFISLPAQPACNCPETSVKSG
jgi:hypothetical protein